MSLLTVSHIEKSYYRGTQAQKILSDVSLNVSTGECVTILGPSGSGKSTLLNICGLIDACDTGELYFQQQALHQLTASQRTEFRRQYLGFVFQQFNLIPVMSVFDNVALPLMLLNWSADEKRTRVLSVLDSIGLLDHADEKPERLSGGQCQRVAVARALVKKPAVIIADEPTASLDAHTALEVMAQMQTLAREQGTAILIATHDARLLPFSDQVLQLDEGQLCADATASGAKTAATFEGVLS